MYDADRRRFNAAVASEVQRQREAAGLTRRDLERRAGLSERTVCRVEEGQAAPFYVLTKLAEALDATTDSFAPLGAFAGEEAAE